MSIVKVTKKMVFITDATVPLTSCKVNVVFIKSNNQVSMQLPTVQLVTNGNDQLLHLYSSNYVDPQFLPQVSYIPYIYFLVPTVNHAYYGSTVYDVGLLVLDCITGQLKIAPDATKHDGLLVWEVPGVSKSFGLNDPSVNYIFKWSV